MVIILWHDFCILPSSGLMASKNSTLFGFERGNRRMKSFSLCVTLILLLLPMPCPAQHVSSDPAVQIHQIMQAHSAAGSDGAAHIRQTDFRDPSDYATRFDELLQAGYPWLNMSCYGIHDGRLIVAIEIPSPRPLHPGCATSVNLSGPSRTVLDSGWRTDAVLTIT